MAAPAHADKSNARRKSVLDLAPLERNCMKALWPLGEGTVRQIRDLLAPILPRAYTTIMTIMDRLAQKGVVTRRKVGRAYLYRPNITVEEARAFAVEQLLENFFAASKEDLLAYLGGHRARAALLSVAGQPSQPTPPRAEARQVEPGAVDQVPAAAPIDESLL